MLPLNNHARFICIQLISQIVNYALRTNFYIIIMGKFLYDRITHPSQATLMMNNNIILSVVTL